MGRMAEKILFFLIAALILITVFILVFPIKESENNTEKEPEIEKVDILPSSITLNKTTIVLNEGESITLEAKILPTNATNKNIIWSSSNTSVATVENGKIKALKAGITTITASTENKKTAICNVKVIKPTLSLNKSSVTINVGSEFLLKANVSPENSKVTWTSSNTSVATVKDGKVVGIKAGTATITAKSNNITAKCIVTVIDDTEPNLDVGSNKVIARYDSATLKYVIASTSTYAVTRVWVKDPYNQLKVALTKPKSSSSPVPRVPDSPANIINNEITNKKYTSKGLVAVNASSVVSDQFGTNLPSDWYGTASTPIVIYEGKVLRNSLDGANPAATSKKIYGLTSSGYLTFYSYTNGATAERIASNQKVLAQIKSDGIRYTFGFWPVLVKNGKFDTNSLSGTTDSFSGKNIRNSICQVDKNNFVLITSTITLSERTSKGLTLEALAHIMESYNCKIGFNLDGGGSTSLYYKKSSATKATKLSTAYDERKLVDMLYFVEQ